jgi:hypothetical protein
MFKCVNLIVCDIITQMTFKTDYFLECTENEGTCILIDLDFYINIMKAKRNDH